MNFEELFYDFLIEAETGAEVDRLISEINDELSSAEDRVLGRLKKGGNGMNRDRLRFTKSKEEVSHHARRLWGHDDIVLTKEDIDKMLDGYFIYYDDGEYSTSLSIEGREAE